MSAVASPDGAVVLMPDEFPKTEDEIFDVLGNVSEVLQDAAESVSNVRRMVQTSDYLSHLQAGALMLRAALYKEIGEGILAAARSIEHEAYERSLYGPAKGD